MAIHTESQVIEAYDYEADEEELSQTFFHDVAIYTLMSILKSLYESLGVGVGTNENVYAKGKTTEPLAPDIVVIDGYIPEIAPNTDSGSYYISDTNPPPRVVFEMTSAETWANDVKLPQEIAPGETVTPNGKPYRVRPKQPRYEAMGIKEYFVFDPHEPTVWTRRWKQENRLMGWRLNTEGKYERIVKNEDGWMWSAQLNCWLVVTGRFLSLYDEHRNRLLSDSERVEVERREREAAQRKNEQLEREKEAERQAKEVERQAKEAAYEKLRELGIDPDSLK